MKKSGMNYRCTACNWSKTIQADEDGIIHGIQGYLECPECGEQDLIMTPINSKPSNEDNS